MSIERTTFIGISAKGGKVNRLVAVGDPNDVPGVIGYLEATAPNMLGDSGLEEVMFQELRKQFDADRVIGYVHLNVRSPILGE